MKKQRLLVTISLIMLLGIVENVKAQENDCARKETIYNTLKANNIDSIRINEVKEELRHCYLNEIEDALSKNNCKEAGSYYEKYKILSGPDSKLEQKIKDCENPVPPESCFGVLRIKGDQSLLKKSKFYLGKKVISDPPIYSEKNIECGIYKFRVELDGYKPFIKDVTIKKDQTTTVEVDLPPIDVDKYGYLQIEGDKTILVNASVNIDNNYWMSKPLEKHRLKCGRHTVCVYHKDCEPYENYNVVIEEGKTVNLEVDLPPKRCYGSLKLEGDQSILSNATITLDLSDNANVRWENPPINSITSIECGTFTIHVRHKDYELFEKEVSVEKGKLEIIKVTMTPLPKTGFLKLEGDGILLSEATITIDGKDARYAIKRPQELGVGEHIVRVVLDCYKPFEQTVVIKGGETKPLSVGLSPTCKEIALLAKTGADIYVDGRFKGTSNWTGKLGFGSYEVECRMKGCKSSRKDIYVNGLTQTPIRLPDPKPFIVNFATVNFAYGFEPQWSFGVGYGRLEWEPFGWFVSVMTNFNSVSVAGDCDAEGFLIDGTCPGFKGQQQRSRLSIMAGGILPFFMDDLYLRIGLGYGERGLYWETNDGLFYRNLGYSIRGFDCSLGYQAHFGRVIWSADYVVTNLKFKQFFEVKMGIGFTF